MDSRDDGELAHQFVLECGQKLLALKASLEQLSDGRQVTEQIIVGKDILDLLTGAMYVDPRSIYREYIQNAADAIEEARAAGLYEAPARGEIKVLLDTQYRNITIRDDGVGVRQKEFVQRLTAIGASKKRGAQLRGFRGVGRLAGLGYCQQLVLRSRALGERKVSELTWDGRLLKDLLKSDSKADLTEAIKSVVTHRVIADDGFPAHFFDVELRSVNRVQNDVLLNEDLIYAYLSQVAPVPFSPEFELGVTIGEFLSRHAQCATFDILVGDKSVYRPHRNEFAITDKLRDTVSGVTFIEAPGLDDGAAAIGWILKHSYFGSIPKRARIEGLRARVGNIQVGSSDIFANLFTEPRFNSWCIGEVHVLSKRILPNGRRDDFEVNAHLQSLQGHLAKIAKDLAQVCREKSIIRNRLRSAAFLTESTQQTIGLLEQGNFGELRAYLEAHASKLLEQLRKVTASPILSEAERAFCATHYLKLDERLSEVKAGAATESPLAQMAPAERRAFEHAIDAVLTSALPIAVRADLAHKIILRAPLSACGESAG